jgi:large subunit ribosomal protein L24
MMSKLHVKTGDTVVLLTGDYKDKYEDEGKRKTGKVVAVSPKEGKVIVEGINMITKHIKPTRMGQPGSIVKAESPIYASKVQLVCPKCGKATRVGHGFEEKKNAAGEMKKIPVRICKKCGHNF